MFFEKSQDITVYHQTGLQPCLARMVFGVPHNADEPRYTRDNYSLLLGNLQWFCVWRWEVEPAYIRGVSVDAYWHLVLDFSPEYFGGGVICRWGTLSEKSEFERTTIGYGTIMVLFLCNSKNFKEDIP